MPPSGSSPESLHPSSSPPESRSELDSAISRSAAPEIARVAIDRLNEADAEFADRLYEDIDLRRVVLAVVSASRSLTELCVADDRARGVLTDLDHRPPLDGDLARWKRLELLRIAARDLAGVDDLAVVGRSLARLADDVLREACHTAGTDDLAVIGMGKLGGHELNYSSDVDVLFVGSDTRGARAVLDIVRTCFRVDVDLRPEGRDGPLVRSLESYEAYWDRWAQTWEFQALIKSRPVAGDSGLGREFRTRVAERLWNRPFTPDDLRAVRAMKARSEAHLARKGLTEREVKRGRGGIRDIEFSVQLLQLVHGGADDKVRSANTLNALAQLASTGYIGVTDARALDHAYRLLRTVEHRLQLVQEQQTHTMPTTPAAHERLARVMGYRDRATATAGELLSEYLRGQQTVVRSIHEHLFFRPLLDALTAANPTAASMPADAVAARLVAFGFTDARRTRQALQELTKGLTRRSRLMQQMLPLLLGWLSESPDPDLGLLGLRLLTSKPQQAMALAISFRESPEIARRLCCILGTSRRLGEVLEHHPDMIPSLGETTGPAVRTPEHLLNAALATLSWRDDQERQQSLQRFKRREELRVATLDILGLGATEAEETLGVHLDPVVATGHRLTLLAEACLQAAMVIDDAQVPMAAIAMGRFGGGELSYASDLDLLFVFSGSSPADTAEAERAVEAVSRFLAGSTPAVQLYPVDLSLRPEGKDGPVARSLDAYRAYYERWAQTWERQALLRARFVGGDSAVGRQFMALVDAYVWRGHLSDDEVRDIRRMKARIEKERISSRDDPQFHLKLGRGSLSDVEFCVQLLQLRHGVKGAATMGALDDLEAQGALGAGDAAILTEAYRFCERTRNRWFLVKGSASDALPAAPEQLARLARSLGVNPAELREEYRRVTRRSRSVVEKLFYGRDTEGA